MMKKFFLKYSLKIVSDYYPDYDEDKLDEIRYGLEATYLSLTKTFVILMVCIILGIIKEALILLLLFNLIRLTGFGLHATKSWMCWISSSITFIGIPFLCRSLVIPTYMLGIVCLFCLICFFLYAPADTKKRPLIHSKRRFIYKVITLLIGIIYTIAVLIVNNSLIQNTLVCAMLIECVLIHPLTYKIFKLPYNNYKTYVLAKNVV